MNIYLLYYIQQIYTIATALEYLAEFMPLPAIKLLENGSRALLLDFQKIAVHFDALVP